VGDSAATSPFGTACLVTAILVFSSNSAVFAEMQAAHPFFDACNTLCGASVVGIVTLVPYFRHDLTSANAQKLERKHWLALWASTLLYSVFGPLLFYMALSRISVPAVAILSRLESLEFLVLSRVFLKEEIDRWSFNNACLTFTGIVVALISPPLFGGTAEFGTGHLFVILSGFCYTLSLFISKRFFVEIPIGIVVVFRVGVGAVVYMVVQVVRNAVTDGLGAYTLAAFWENVVWFALVYVTLGQIVWLNALVAASATTISVGTTSLFVLTLAWSTIIQSRIPTGPELLGSAFIATSVASSILRVVKTKGTKQQRAAAAPRLQRRQGSNVSAGDKDALREL
jgi:drug/metabolite transporter (DMT)-like permease